MADNTTLNTGTGGDVIASKDIAGVKHQQVAVEGQATDYFPNNTERGFTESQLDEAFMAIDPDGSVITRGGIITDEGSYYSSFPGVALPADITGTTGTGQTITVSNSNAVIAAGTTANAEAYISLPIDYLPLKAVAKITISQRIANQDIYFEVANGATPAADTQFGRLHWTGTTNTFVRGESQSSTDTNGNEGTGTDLTQTTSANATVYAIEVTQSCVRFSYGASLATDVFLALNCNERPGIYEPLYLRVRVKNGGSVPASNTDITVNWIYAANVDRLDIGTIFTTEGSPVSLTTEGNTVRGDKQHNTATASSDAFEILPAVANAAAPTYTEGNVVRLRTTLSGDVAVTLDSETVTVQATNLDIRDLSSATDSITVAATDLDIRNLSSAQDNVAAVSAGDVAHDSPDSGNPVKVGGIARTANPTAAGALDRVAAFFDTEGRQITQPFGPRALTLHNTITLTSTTETTLLAAAAGVFHDLLAIVCINTSATATRVDVRDGTAGTIRFAIYVPAGQTAGFMPPIPVTASATNANWTAQLSGAVTDVRIFAMAIKKTG